MTSADQWVNHRRPEIVDMVQNYMYGYLPPAPTNLTGTILSEDADYLGDGSATRRVIQLNYGPAGTKPAKMNLYIPNHVTGPAPVGSSWTSRSASPTKESTQPAANGRWNGA